MNKEIRWTKPVSLQSAKVSKVQASGSKKMITHPQKIIKRDKYLNSLKNSRSLPKVRLVKTFRFIKIRLWIKVIWLIIKAQTKLEVEIFHRLIPMVLIIKILEELLEEEVELMQRQAWVKILRIELNWVL